MPTDFANVFEVLIAARVRFVVVGGLAVLLHGVDRLTADIDIAIDLAAGSASTAMAALLAAGLRPIAPVDAMQFADPAVRGAWHRDRGMEVFSLWDPEHRRPTVDVFAEAPIPFEELWADSVDVALGKLRVRIASIAHLEGSRGCRSPPRSCAPRNAAIWQTMTIASPSKDNATAPVGFGSWEDAERLRQWSFLQRTPEQRLAWLIDVLEVAYQCGALVPRGPAVKVESADPVSADLARARSQAPV
jgi:hypothetical protein